MFLWVLGQVLGCAPGWLCQVGGSLVPGVALPGWRLDPAVPGMLPGEAEAAPSPSLCAPHTPARAPGPTNHHLRDLGISQRSQKPSKQLSELLHSPVLTAGTRWGRCQISCPTPSRSGTAEPVSWEPLRADLGRVGSESQGCQLGW